MKYQKLTESLTSSNRHLGFQNNCLSRATTISQGLTYLKPLLLGLVGVSIGGPVGLVIIKLTHAPFAISMLIEGFSVITGTLVTGLCLGQSSKGGHCHLTIIDLLSLDQQIGLRDCVLRQEVEDIFQKLSGLILTTPLCNWYQAIISDYYRKVNWTLKTSNKLKYLKETLDLMVLDLVRFLTVECHPDDAIIHRDRDQDRDVDRDVDRALNVDNSNETLTRQEYVTIKIYPVSEMILMMSLYHDLYRYSRQTCLKHDKIYNLKRQKFKAEIDSSPQIVHCFNQIPTKITVSQKISLLLTICGLIANQEFIDCDCLLIAFVNNLVKSQLKHPFTEILIIETMLPKQLIGQEAYVFSTFSASVHYIFNS